MPTVVIFGSRSIKSLPYEAMQSIERIISLQFDVLVGDANGVDLLVQNFLKTHGYDRVTVCYSNITGIPGNGLRENTGFDAIPVIGNYIARDKWMCDRANYGLAIWDGRSPGSKRNIQQLGNRCKVIVPAKVKG
jgi:adenine-specific DNA-methyltransferase